MADIDLGRGLGRVDLAAIARERHPEVEVVLIGGARPGPDAQAPGRCGRFLRKPLAPPPSPR